MDSGERKFKIAISKLQLERKPSKDEKNSGKFFARLNHSYVNKETTAVGIGNAILQGRSFTAWHTGGVRDSQYWKCCQYCVIDLDRGDETSDIELLRENDFVQNYAAILYTTMSHTPAHPRCRIIFLLDKAIDDPLQWKTLSLYLLQLFQGGDPASANISQQFFGNRNAEIAFPGRVLSVNYVRFAIGTYQKYMEKRREEQGAPPLLQYANGSGNPATRRQVENWLRLVETAGMGSRNVTLSWAACAMGRHAVQSGVLTVDAAQNALKAAALRTGLPENEVERTILSAFRKVGAIS